MVEPSCEEAGLTREDFVKNEVPGMIWKEEARDVLIKPRDIAEVRIEPDEHEPRARQGDARSSRCRAVPTRR